MVRALRLHGAGDIRLDDIARPEVGSGDVGIRVAWAGICGSDIRLYVDGPSTPAEVAHPLFGEVGPHTLGHEFSGYVDEVGDGVVGVQVGDLVALRPNRWDGDCPACLRGEVNLCEHSGFVGISGAGGGFSDRVVGRAEAVHRLPPGISPEAGALVESLSVAWHAVKRADPRPRDAALVVGAGPIGLAVLLCLRAHGVGTIVVSEPGRERAELARRLGAIVVDPRTEDPVTVSRAATAGRGVDISFDAAGFSDETFRSAYDALRNGGRCVIVARVHHDVPVDLAGFLVHEKTVTGSYAYRDEDFDQVIDAIARGTIDPLVLVSSRIPLEDVIARGFDHLLGEGRSTELKILVAPGGPGMTRTSTASPRRDAER